MFTTGFYSLHVDRLVNRPVGARYCHVNAGWRWVNICRMSENQTGGEERPVARGAVAIQVFDELHNLLRHEKFTKAPRISRFLKFVINEELAGRGARINGTQIAIEVYDRDQTFDPKTDPIVRVEAQRLRRILDKYYADGSNQGKIQITIPKGGYRPSFQQPGQEPDSAGQVSADLSLYPELPNNPVIAVLPFRNLAEAPGGDYFSEGFAGSLITALTRFEVLEVIAQQSTAKYAGSAVDIRVAGRELGARFILEGTVQRDRGRIRVTVSLSDSEDGTQLWGEAYDRDLNTHQLFELEDLLTSAVIARVGDAFGAIPRLLAKEARGKPAESLETYEAIQRFFSYMGSFREEDYLEARKALEIATKKEPDFAPVWSSLSILCCIDFMRGYTGKQGMDRYSWELANRAVSLDAGSSSAHLARCVSAYVNKNRETVISEGEKAIALNPNAVAAVSFAANLIGLAGEMERGISILEEVDKLNPFYPSWLLGLRCLDYYMKGRYEAALKLAGRFTHDSWSGKPLYTAAILGQLGKSKLAGQQLVNLKRLDPGFSEDPEAFLRQRYFFDDQVEKMLDGLVKAGL